MLNNDGITRTIEYLLISDFYGNRTAQRSGVPLMNHINEGLYIMGRREASISARRAFCIHPLVQRDEDLALNWEKVIANCDRYAIMLAMEYRNVANQYLSKRIISSLDEIALSPLADVNEMLVADKIQNWKDFVTFHYDTHPRRHELTDYFDNWLVRLAVIDEAYDMRDEIDNFYSR